MSMKFEYIKDEPCVLDGWMEKAKVGVWTKWQRRFFRLQGRCIFYFKEEFGEAPRGKIPLCNVEVSPMNKKGRNEFGFIINIDAPEGVAKRPQYLIRAESNEQRTIWMDAIVRNCAYTIVGKRIIEACKVTPTNNQVSQLLPYFIPPIMNALDRGEIKEGLWTQKYDDEALNPYMELLDKNMAIPTNDHDICVAVLTKYLTSLPTSLIPSDEILSMREKPTYTDIRKVILETNAVSREVLKVLGYHWKKVVDKEKTPLKTLADIIGPILIRQKSGGMMPPAQVKDIQTHVAEVFVTNYSRIMADIHQFLEAPRQVALRRARLSFARSNTSSDSELEGPRGLLVNIVREDEYSWCTVFTSNKRVGLIHDSQLKRITPGQEEPEIDSLFDVVRENMPNMILLLDSMMDEAVKMREFLDS